MKSLLRSKVKAHSSLWSKTCIDVPMLVKFDKLLTTVTHLYSYIQSKRAGMALTAGRIRASNTLMVGCNLTPEVMKLYLSIDIIMVKL